MTGLSSFSCDLAVLHAIADAIRWLDSLEVHIDSWASDLGRSGEMILRLIVAAVLGGLIGSEREINGHPAGFRTFLVVSAGSALAMVVSQALAFGDFSGEGGIPSNDAYRVVVDPGRIAYGVLTGVGFLGAGTIMRHQSRIRGLTTAAGIWAVAAVGLAAGHGMYVISIVATILLLAVLAILGFISDAMPTRQVRRIRVRINDSPDVFDRVAQIATNHGLKVENLRLTSRVSGKMVKVEAAVSYFHHDRWEKLCRHLLEDESVVVDRLG